MPLSWYDHDYDAIEEFVRVALRISEANQREAAYRGMLPQHSFPSSMNLQNYSLTKALKCALEGRRTGFEAETHQELARGMKSLTAGFLIPIAAIAAKAQNTLTGPAGGFTVGTSVPVIADALRPSSVAISSGALMIDLEPNAIVPRITTGAVAHWLAETETCPESGATLGTLALTPRRVATWMKVSNQLLAQAPIADAVLMTDLRAAIGAALDLGVFSGVGGMEPLGLLNNTTNAVQTVTFGNAANREELAAMERKLGDENANDLNSLWVTAPAVREKWRNTANPAGITGALWGDDNRVLGRPARASNNITDNRAILGNFADLIIVNWGVIEIQDKFTSAKSGQTEFLMELKMDAGPIRPKSFVVTTDSAAQ